MLVLASASPRRQELLRNARIPFRTYPALIPEIRKPGEAPTDYAQRLAQEKARAVYASLRPPAGTLVLGADTIVVLGEEVLEKPAHQADAVRMLRKLAGGEHKVITGVCLVGLLSGQDNQAIEHTGAEKTRVFFGMVTEEEIAGYVATGEPMDKAGAYAIQGMASRWVHRIEGDYGNVVGLPVALVCRMLRECGFIL